MRFKDYYQILGITKELFLEENWENKMAQIHQKLFLTYYPNNEKSETDIQLFININDGFAIFNDIKTKEYYDEFLDLTEDFVVTDLTEEGKYKLYHILKTIKEKRSQTQKIINNNNKQFVENLNLLDLFLHPYSPHSNDTIGSNIFVGMGDLIIDLGEVSETGFSFLGDIFTIDF